MKNGPLTLDLHDYTFFPYERDLAVREVAALVGGRLAEGQQQFRVSGAWRDEHLWRLTYFARYENGSGPHETLQHTLEKSHHAAMGRKQRRQSTRYSVHGLHEYKGKFNPQVAHALLNIFGADSSHQVLDPFCGSGTTLVEAAHLGIAGTGLDMNPLAVFLANAKLSALWSDVDAIRRAFQTASRAYSRRKPSRTAGGARHEYLAKWFTPEILTDLERLRAAIEEVEDAPSKFLFAAASDLLRDWSLQDPADLRIRRRQSPLPEQPFFDAWSEVVRERLAVLESVQPLLRRSGCHLSAMLRDSRDPAAFENEAGKFDFVITSPPYATALPYIDTQRLSLVWLGLIEPEEIRRLEAGVLGSREVLRGRDELAAALENNAAGLPCDVLKFCKMLARSLGAGDGFRRQAVPMLLYRYLAGMKATFANLHRALRKGGRMAWVVGVNQTTLGGKPIVIDTPALLCRVAETAGFRAEEPIPLQTYQRYSVHQKNAIRGESILLFRR
jgi:SAM-dependent methyltransferase